MITPKEILNKATRKYVDYLCSLVQGNSFFPLIIPADKKVAADFAEQHKELQTLISRSKDRIGYGYSIEYQTVQTRKHGTQDVITAIVFTSETDYLQYLNKLEEVARFKEAIIQLLKWQPNLQEWLIKNPGAVFQYLPYWKGICAVTDYLLQQDVSHHYLRSIPVPVHTKFIKEKFTIIHSLLRYLHPNRFDTDRREPEMVLGLLRKPFLFTLRWLDPTFATEYSSGMEVFATAVDHLKRVHWPVKRVIMVENETNLYLLPALADTLALVSSGKALHLLKEVPLFSQVALYYWGDLDEQGFVMLNDMRVYYPHIQSFLMDEQVVLLHQQELDTQPAIYKTRELPALTTDERHAFKLIAWHNGRIEQERLSQEYVHDSLLKLK
jgi:hypothetical protein